MELAELKAKVDLRTVLEHYGFDLQGSGTVLSTLCPFHDEQTPSFKLWESTQKWQCFGCGAHGDVIDFVIRYEDCSIAEAARKLENQALGPPIIRKKRIKPQVLPISEEIVQEYHKELQARKEVIRWLWEKRHWSEEVIERHTIGLWNGRIQIPVRHPLSNTIVDVRQYRPGAKPKMLPYDKDRGAWPYIIGPKGDDLLVITEGEPDALAVASLGFAAATNTCGALAAKSVWHQWCGLILAPTVILAFDNDEPGETAQKVMKRLTSGIPLTFPELGRKADITDAITAYGQDSVRRRIREAASRATVANGTK